MEQLSEFIFRPLAKQVGRGAHAFVEMETEAQEEAALAAIDSAEWMVVL